MSFAESKRTNFKLDLLKLKDFKMSKVGEWTPLSGLNITDRYAFLQGKSFLFFLCYTQGPEILFTKTVLPNSIMIYWEYILGYLTEASCSGKISRRHVF